MKFDSVEALKAYAAEFAAGLKAPQAVALYGNLGAGKTEFVRAVINSLMGGGIVVPSPTFTLSQKYKNISHFDLYRIKKVEELEEIGFFDALVQDIVFIEWPEIAEPYLPASTIKIVLEGEHSAR